MRTAKVFKIGRKQAVELPAAFRFDEKEVFISRDPATGNVILSKKPDWDEFVRELNALGGIPEDFLADRDMTLPPQRPDL